MYIGDLYVSSGVFKGVIVPWPPFGLNLLRSFIYAYCPFVIPLMNVHKYMLYKKTENDNIIILFCKLVNNFFFNSLICDLFSTLPVRAEP